MVGYRKAKKVTTCDDIQDWIKTVETASNRAAAVAFGAKYVPPPQSNPRHVPLTVDPRLHEAAYSEAQELLQQWASEKLNYDNRDSFDERWDETAGQPSVKTATEVRQEWDQLTADDDYDIQSFNNPAARRGRKDKSKKSSDVNPVSETDPFKLLNADEDDVVGAILQGLLRKQVVRDDFLQDIGLDATKKQLPNPHTKMELRHQQVKENRERRMKEKQKQMQELQLKREAELNARQMLMKEEKAKETKRNQEELEIQKEMARIRKQLEDEKRKKAVEISRKKQEAELLESALKDRSEQLKAAELQAVTDYQVRQDERRKKILAKLEDVERQRIKENMKLKRQCFSAWYNVVIARRLQLGKAKATADWKVLFRTFSAWKSLHTGKKVEQQVSRHEQQVKQMHRNEVRAVEHYRIRLLTKAIRVWKDYIDAVQRAREIERTRIGTRNKMAAFLDAAASGRLWTDRTARSDGQSDPERDDNKGESHVSGVSSSRSQPAGPSKSVKQAVSDANVVCKPKEAWQVTRQHLKLTADQMSDTRSKSPTAGNASRNVSQKLRTRRASETNLEIPLEDDDVAGHRNGAESSLTSRTTQPNTSSVMNGFENRYRAQQQLLKQQQKQLQDQQRMITEMQALQRQQILQQQLARTHAAASTKQTGDKKNYEPSHLYSHLTNVQNEVLGFDVGVDKMMDDESSRSPPPPGQGQGQTSRSEANSTPSTAVVDNRHTKFLEAMHQRAAERARIKKEREEKRQKQEEEKLLQLQKADEERRQQEEEEKKLKARMIRERKELERQKEAEKQKEIERLKELASKAEEHHRKSIIKYWGWRPWRKLISDGKDLETKARQLYRKTLLGCVLRAWHEVVTEERQQKEKCADEMNRYLLLRKCLAGWRKCKHIAEIDERKAVRFCERHTKSKVFRSWCRLVVNEKLSHQQKEMESATHNILRIKRTCFRAWKRYPVVVREQEQVKKRLEEMRKTVAALIPDYSLAAAAGTSVGSDSDS